MILLVMDVQKGLVNEKLYDANNVVNNIVKLIEVARENRVDIIHVQHHSNNFSDDDFQIVDKVLPAGNERVFVKSTSSCFGSPDFAQFFELSGEKEVMIVGLQTDFCVDATIKSAFEKGYKVFVPQGTNSSVDNQFLSGEKTVKYYNDFIWPDTFAKCISLNDAIALLNR